MTIRSSYLIPGLAIMALTANAQPPTATQPPRALQPAPRPVVVAPQPTPAIPTVAAPATSPYAAQFAKATRAIDTTLRGSLQSYVGLSITPQGQIRVTVANPNDFTGARTLGTNVLGQASRANPNLFNQALGRANLVLTQAALGPAQLADARARMRDVLTLPRVVFLDLDESCGCITVGISDPAVQPAVRAFAAQRGVPANAVNVVTTAPIVAMSSLQGAFRPTLGGAQIQFPDDDGSIFNCSLGLPVFAFSTGAPGFLTASHCTAGPRGAMKGTWFSQPGGAPFWGDKVGVESIDHAMFGSSTDPACPAGRSCRYSDTAFIAYDKPEFGWTGHIVRPQTRCTAKCDLNVARVTDDIRVVLADASDPNLSPMMGEIVDKVGRTTGWTSGAVSNTCTDVDVINDDGSDSGMTILCQTLVSAVDDHGDSGSPVFEFNPATGAAVFEGVLWGGNSTHTTFVFSPLSGIQKELGTFVYNQAGVTAPFFSNGEFYTADNHDDIHVTVEPNAAPAGSINIVLSSGPGIVWQKQLVIAGGALPTSTILTVINNIKTANVFLPANQLPGAHMEFRKLYGAHTGTDEVTRIPLDAIAPGTRLTFTWNRD